MQGDSEGLNFEQTLVTLRRRAPLILLCFALAAAAAYGYSTHQTRQYTATASLDFGNNPLSQQIVGSSTSSGSSSGSLAQQESNLELVKLGNVAVKTANQLSHGLTADKVSESVTIAKQGESSVVDVSATTTSPTLAAGIANTYARQFVQEQRSTNRQYLKSALALVNRQLARLSPAQRQGEDGLNLQDRVQTLSLLLGLDYGNVQVAQEASPPTGPSSPKTSRNTALGALLGLLIGLGLALVLERLDHRIKNPDDLEAIYNLRMLGEVPESAALARSARRGKGKAEVLPPAEAEAFSLIRAHLRFFNIDRDLRTVVIASAAPGDGKTTIARHLAEAAARLGSQVLLVEVDMRQPTLAQQLDIDSGPGLADVLIDATTIDSVTQSVAFEVAPGGGVKGRTLDVVTAGAMLPPNPGELLESKAMGAFLERVRTIYDLVVIDTPPLSAVSDAFPLLTRVDGVVVVGRVGRSRRDVSERLHQVLASSGAPLLGVIANGAKSGGPNPYLGGKRSSTTKESSKDISPPPEDFVPTAQA